jgi:uncharacterized protein (TIGR03067 family)
MNSAFLIGMALVVTAPAPKEVPKKEAPAIVGSWSLEKAEVAGMALPIAAAGEQLSLTFAEDGTVIARRNGKEEPGLSRFTHDAKKSPAEIDPTEARAGAKEMTVKGIYKIDVETLTICMTPMGERPTKFDSAGQTIVMTFRRLKKE